MFATAYLDMTSAVAGRLIDGFATDDDREASRMHRRPVRQRQSLGVRVLLRALLAHEAGLRATSWRISRAGNGAPLLSGDRAARPPFISFSHSGPLVACAVGTAGPVGIDIERLRRDRPIAAIARAAFGPAELQSVLARGAAAFYRIWVLREALAKATGAGFPLLVNGIDLVAQASSGVSPSARIADATWNLGYWALGEGYGLGVAAPPPACVARPRHVTDRPASRFAGARVP